MDLINKKALLINLETRKFEVQVYPNLQKYIGGVGLALKLYELYANYDPLIISVGPLNGFFPFASKTCVVLSDNGVVEDLYIGGTLSTRVRFTGVDAIVITGKAEEETLLEIVNTKVSFKGIETDPDSLGLPGRRSTLDWYGPKVLLDKYFGTHEDILENKSKQKNIRTLSITGTELMKPKDFDEYQRAYSKVLARKNSLTIEESNYPSCANCPMGCMMSKSGELGGDVIAHSLVTCQFADKIFTDVGIVFSCLNALGYEYTHEDIENLPKLIQATLKNLV